MGNVTATSKGPAAYGKRLMRRKVYAKTNSALSRVLRSMGL